MEILIAQFQQTPPRLGVELIKTRQFLSDFRNRFMKIFRVSQSNPLK